MSVIESILGNTTIEKVLLFLERYEQGYPSEIARVFEKPLFSVQRQLQRLEDGGVVISRLHGKVRIYQFNPRYPFLRELRALLARAMEVLPQEEIDKYYMRRTRPRRAGKPW